MTSRTRVTTTLLCTCVLVCFISTRAKADVDDDEQREHDSVMADVIFDTEAPGTLIALRVPGIADVLEAAYVAAGLDRDPTPSWIRRARVAGLVPWVSAKVGWNQRWHDDEPGDVGRNRTFEVRATWRLDRLVFDPRELQMSSIDMARRRERRRLASRVIRAYFEWKKAVAISARGDRQPSLAVEATTAELDALTDGWFSGWFSERTKSTR